MFPSGISSIDPLEYTFTGTQNPSRSIQEEHPLSFLHLPSPFVGDYDLLLGELLSQQQEENMNVSALAVDGHDDHHRAHHHETNPDNEDSNKDEATRINKNKKRSNANAVPRKRTRKKDRHSKIYTAQGPRDRRMRLSLQIARKFFDLQDILGFDKASKTIEWLITKSKAAIKELTDSLPLNQCSSGGGKSVISSTSESEVVSSIKNKVEEVATQGGDSFSSNPGETESKKSVKQAVNHHARESRDKARARARKRTMEKMKIKSLDKFKQCSDQAANNNPSNLEQLVCYSPIGENIENLDSCSLEVNSLVKGCQMDSADIIDRFLGITSATASSSNFDFGHNFSDINVANFAEYSGFAGNWNIYSAMPKFMPITGNIHEQNPNAIFNANIPFVRQQQKTSSNFVTSASNSNNPQEQILSSNSLTTLNSQLEEHPNSFFMNTPSRTTNEENPSSSIFMAAADIGLHSHFIGNQFSSSSNIANKYDALY